MIIRKFKQKDAKEVCKVVSKTFNEFVAPKFTKKAIKKWLKEQTPEEQIKRAKTRDVYIAIINNKIVGMIEGIMVSKAGNNRISRLFVSKKYQRKGIGGKLLVKIEKLFQKRGVKRLTVRSSPYAENFYERLGYKKTTKLIKKDGMVYQPMAKILYNTGSNITR